MIDIPDLPSPTVAQLLTLVIAEDEAGVELLLRRAASQGAALRPELTAALEFAHELPPDEAATVRALATEIATATRDAGTVEVALRDLARHPEDERAEPIEIGMSSQPDDWIAVALRVRAETGTGDDDLREVCRAVLALAEPGTPGVLPALLEDLDPDDPRGVADLCAHGDPASAEAVLDWQRAQGDADAIDDFETASAVYGVVAAALIWGADVTPDDIERANAAADVMRFDLEASIEDLQDELEDAEAALADVHPLRLPGDEPSGGTGFGHGAGPKVARNAQCPCGSGKKFKKCCE